MVKVNELQAKNIMTRSNLPGFDFVINPYTGCAFACSYCYASFMGRFVDEPLENWGNYVYAKTNAVELLDSQLTKMRNKDKTIFMASVTDAWQYVEKNYELTRGILKTFIKHNYAGKITCLTKSDLILRDIDLLSQLKNVEVGFTVTSANNAVSRSLEVAAPNVEKRIEALAQLNKAGIKTYAFLAPVLPHFINHKEDLEDLFIKLKNAGTTDIYIDMLNTKDYIRKNLDLNINKQSEEIKKSYSSMLNNDESVRVLKRFLYNLTKKYEFNLLNERNK